MSFFRSYSDTSIYQDDLFAADHIAHNFNPTIYPYRLVIPDFEAYFCDMLRLVLFGLILFWLYRKFFSKKITPGRKSGGNDQKSNVTGTDSMTDEGRREFFDSEGEYIEYEDLKD